MKYKKLVEELLTAVGGKENISSATHCFTRLRLTFNDRQKVSDEMIKNIKGVVGINERGSEYQIIIGNTVADVYKEFAAIAGIKNTAAVVTNKSNEKLFDKIIDIVVGIFIPIIGLIAASGTLKGVIAILAQFNIISSQSGSYTVLYATANAIFYFFPVMVGFTAGKKFSANPYLTALIGLILVYPDIISSAGSTENLDFFGIPMVMVSYTSTVLPVIFGAWIAAKIQKFCEKIIPNVLRMIFVPFFVLITVIPLLILAVGPLATIISDGMAEALETTYTFSPILAGLIFGGLWQVVILFGLAWGVVPVLITYLAKFGYDPIYGMLVPAAMGQAGATLAVAVKTKSSKMKSLAYSTGLSGVLGITEPAMYGVTIPTKRPFIFGCIGSSIGGAIAGVAGVKMYAPGLSGIFNIAGYLGAENLQQNLFWGCTSLLIAFIVGFSLTFIFGWNEQVDDQEGKAKSAHHLGKEIYSPVSGSLMGIHEVHDDVFSKKLLGDGFAIVPDTNVIYGPVSGTIMSIFPTKHAIGIKSDTNQDVILHVGLDTVELAGRPFDIHVKEGEKIDQNTKLMTVDLKQLEKAKKDASIIVAFPGLEQVELTILEKKAILTGEKIGKLC